jgi:hypothetical protein
MKINSLLYKKQIDIKTWNSINGGGTGCPEVEYTGSPNSGSYDTLTSHYNENGDLVGETYTHFR